MRASSGASSSRIRAYAGCGLLVAPHVARPLQQLLPALAQRPFRTGLVVGVRAARRRTA